MDFAKILYGNCRSFPSSASHFNTEIEPYSSPMYLYVVTEYHVILF